MCPRFNLQRRPEDWGGRFGKRKIWDINEFVACRIDGCLCALRRGSTWVSAALVLAMGLGKGVGSRACGDPERWVSPRIRWVSPRIRELTASSAGSEPMTGSACRAASFIDFVDRSSLGVLSRASSRAPSLVDRGMSESRLTPGGTPRGMVRTPVDLLMARDDGCPRMPPLPECLPPNASQTAVDKMAGSGRQCGCALSDGPAFSRASSALGTSCQASRVRCRQRATARLGD